MRPARLLAALAVALAVVLGAGPAAPATSGPPYTINVIVSLTSSYANVGMTDAQALRVLETDVNKRGGIGGRPLHFDIHDDESLPTVAVQLATQIIATHPAVVLGSNGGSICNAMMPLFANGPVMYCLVPSIYPPKNGYVFAASLALNPYVAGMIQYLRLRGWTRLAIISSTDGSGLVDDTATKTVLTYPDNKDLKVVAWEHFNPTDFNVGPQASRIRGSGAQAVVAWASGTPFGTILRSFNDAGVELPIMTTGGNMFAGQLEQYQSFYPKQLFFPGISYLIPSSAPANLRPTPPMRKAISEFTTEFKAANVEPIGMMPFVWDAAQLVVSALRKLGPDATATQVRDYLLAVRNFGGIDGVYDFSSGDQHGLSDRSVVIVSFDPATRQFYAVSGLGAIPLPHVEQPKGP